MASFISNIKTLKKGSLAIAGVPFDAYSSYLRGAARAPDLIRDAFKSDSANTFAEGGSDIQDHPGLNDLGNMPLKNYFDIEKWTRAILERTDRVLFLGGDHSITYPIMKAYAEKHTGLTILQFDAHSDLYHDFEGNPYSHACPFARIMEEGLVRRLIQVGVRTLTTHLREQARRFDVEIHEMRHGMPGSLQIDSPVYLSLDLDVLDPAFAPGISHYEPGGMSTREVLYLIQQLDQPVVGADIVEYNPLRDINGMTAMVASKFFREIVEKIIAE